MNFLAGEAPIGVCLLDCTGWSRRHPERIFDLSEIGRRLGALGHFSFGLLLLAGKVRVRNRSGDGLDRHGGSRFLLALG